MVKLDTYPRLSLKHRRAARKATLTEAARDDAEHKQNNLSTAQLPGMTQRRTVTAAKRSQVLNLFAVREKIICRTQFVHLDILEPLPGSSGTQSQTMPGPSHTQGPSPTHKNVPRALR